MPAPKDLSRKALALLETLGCEATPKAYAVAYAYVRAPDGPMALDVMAAVSRRRRLDDADIERLYGKHLETGPAGIDATAGDLGRRIGETMEAVGAGLASTRGAAERVAAMAGGEGTGIGEVLRDILAAQGELWGRLRETSGELEAMRRRYEEIVEETRRDPLTQLSNRRAYEEHLSRDIARSARSGSPLSLVVVDIDHFKAVNDSFGHSTGDKVIRLVGKTLQGCVRSSDMTARLGGEEYAMILPDTPLDRAEEVAERIRRTIDAYAPLNGTPGAEARKVTVSVGVASFREGDDPDTLFQRADACLYAAKRGGRNRVVSEASVSPAPEPAAGGPTP